MTTFGVSIKNSNCSEAIPFAYQIILGHEGISKMGRTTFAYLWVSLNLKKCI